MEHGRQIIWLVHSVLACTALMLPAFVNGTKVKFPKGNALLDPLFAAATNSTTIEDVIRILLDQVPTAPTQHGLTPLRLIIIIVVYWLVSDSLPTDTGNNRRYLTRSPQRQQFCTSHSGLGHHPAVGGGGGSQGARESPGPPPQRRAVRQHRPLAHPHTWFDARLHHRAADNYAHSSQPTAHPLFLTPPPLADITRLTRLHLLPSPDDSYEEDLESEEALEGTELLRRRMHSVSSFHSQRSEDRDSHLLSPPSHLSIRAATAEPTSADIEAQRPMSPSPTLRRPASRGGVFGVLFGMQFLCSNH